jgi:plastocyanin
MSTEFSTVSPEKGPRTAGVKLVDPRWLMLQRSVAIGMIVAFAAVMGLVAQAVVPPLAIGAIAFALPLVLMRSRPKGAAIAIGVLSVLWVLFTLPVPGAVIDDLLQPEEVVEFMVTLALLVLPLAGVVGLIGILRRSAAVIATRTMQATIALVVAGAVIGVGAMALSNDEDNSVTATGDDDAVVALESNEFEPESMSVPTGTTVTWRWDEDVEHNIVADEFDSGNRSRGTFEHTFDNPGTYSYECTLHPGMTGEVTVDAAIDR